jgi:hypothetical protein
MTTTEELAVGESFKAVVSIEQWQRAMDSAVRMYELSAMDEPINAEARALFLAASQAIRLQATIYVAVSP